MRFCEEDWRENEPDYATCMAAAYLESKGYRYLEHFDRYNALVMAESLYRIELMGNPDAEKGETH